MHQIAANTAIDASRRDARGTVDVVIVNWNAGAMLAACIAAIARADHRRIARVVVVDNGSTDGSADLSEPALPLQIVEMRDNLGFGVACNRGAATGSATYILLLNPDTEITPDAIERACAYLDRAAPDVGVVGIRLTGRDGLPHRHCARFPTWRSFVGNSLGLTRLFARSFPPITMQDFDHLSSRKVDHVMGAFYLIKRSLYEALGGFDERFFVYLEDLDLSRRVQRAGYETHYVADISAFHHQGGTTEKVRAHRLFYSLSSGIIYAFKHFPRAHAVALAALTFLGEPLSRSVRAAARGSIEEVHFTLSGFAMLYRSTGTLLRTIRSIVTERPSNNARTVSPPHKSEIP